MADARIQPLRAASAAEPDVAVARFGGKAASLLRLTAAGLPVPDGFVITTEGYRDFLAENDLEASITSIVQHRSPDRAADRVRELITAAAVPESLASAITTAYRALGGARVAVRSSATAEDLPGLSFAGQQETVLNVSGVRTLLAAVQICWASLWSARAIGYRGEHQVPSDGLALAVVVQRMVDAEASGVMFTADPITGATGTIMIESAWGLGESVVSGQVTPDRFRFDAAAGELVERVITEKSIMTVRTRAGTAERPVPAARRGLPSLTDAQVEGLARLGTEIAELYGVPMDVEWSGTGDALEILQARPITTGGHTDDPWNDSRGVRCLWTRGNVGEAIPDVMTPATWCLVREFLADAMPTSSVPPYVAFGIVGGRLYLNLSMAASVARCAGIGERLFRLLTREVFGRLPDTLSIPYLRLPPARVARLVVPVALSMTVHARRDARRLPDYLHDHPERCHQLRKEIAAIDHPLALSRLWTEVIHPEFHTATLMLTAATRSDGPVLVTIRRSLQRTMGPADTERLLAGHGGEGELASLGPLIGLEQLADGTIGVEDFRERYGHRGPHEFEISIPRPAEDAAWVERAVTEQAAADYSVSELLRRQVRARADAWQRFARDHPHRVAGVRAKVERWAEISRKREEARSEVVRFFWVLRAFWVRAGELTGVGDDVFSYDWNEVVELLGGRRLDPRELRDRRNAYHAYAALPPYPSVIMGGFDPFAWAADPDRPMGVYVEGDRETPPGPEMADVAVSGFAGSAGVVEGVARVLTAADRSSEFAAGEILVTNVTNVGWTPLFPRARAVITDVGAPLSHAAIVARELGIPAVVGCGDATSVLHTGDLVRVDGTRGTVQILRRADDHRG